MKTSWIAGLMVCVTAAAASAQSTGEINGRIADPSNAALPGATVVVTNELTGVKRESVANASGLFNVPALQPGTYEVRVDLAGFASAGRRVTVVTGTATTVDFVLGLAGVEEALTVTGEAPLVDTRQSGVAGSLRVSEVQELPVLNRNFTGLVTLVPGARPAPVTNQTKGQMGNGISVGGGRGVNVNVLVDGSDNRDDITGGPLQNYTLEGVQEFTLMTHQFGAQYGRSSGAVLQIATKGGSNQLRGSGFFFGRNDAMTAIDHFTREAGLPKNEYARQQFGGSFGAPLVRDRWFVFAALERTQQDFWLTANPRSLAEAQYLTQFGIEPTSTMPMPTRDLMHTLKTDLQLAPNQGLAVRWGHQTSNLKNDLFAFGTGGGGTTTRPDLTAPQYTQQDYWSLTASHTWVIGNAALNQLTVHRNDSLVSQSLQGGSLESPITGFPPPTRTLSFPSVNSGRPLSGDQFMVQDKWQIKNDFSLQWGQHALKAGGDFAWYPAIGIYLSIGTCGSTSFFDDPSVIANNTNGRYPNGFLTPGIVSNITQGTCSAGGPLGDSTIDGVKQVGAYVQDDWRVTPRLTLNLGVRYDVDIQFFNQRYAADSRIYQVLAAIGHPFGALPGTDLNNVSPRVGFAWDMAGDGRSVLRGGYGVFFDPSLQGNVWSSVLFMKPELTASNVFVNTAVGVGQLADHVFNVSPLPPGTGPVLYELPPGGRTSGNWLSPDYSNPYTHQIHAGYTHQIGRAMALSADFTHIEGRDEFRGRQINPLASGVRLLAPDFGSVLGDPNILGPITVQESINRSRFDEVVVALERRGSRLTLQGNYTLAWARGYGGSIGAIGGGGTATPQPVVYDQPFGPGEWGPAGTDERHRIVLSGIFMLPWGIQASPVFQAASARPYNLTAGIDLNGDGTNNDRYVDPATGEMVAVNSARGDASYNLDIRITKLLALGGASRLNLFAEVFNIANRANFGNQFVGNSRSIQFMQPNGYLAGLPTSRQLQLGARFTF